MDHILVLKLSDEELRMHLEHDDDEERYARISAIRDYGSVVIHARLDSLQVVPDAPDHYQS